MLDRVLNTPLLEVPKFAKFDWLDALGQYKNHFSALCLVWKTLFLGKIEQMRGFPQKQAS